MITIGPSAPEGDAVDLLLDCHERIRRFTELAARLAAAQGAPLAEVAEAAAQVRRYFVEALPRHAADEEESVVPRLAGKDPSLDRELEEMRGEHAAHEGPAGDVVAVCEVLASDPARLPQVANELAERAAALSQHFDEHLLREESVVFPAMRRLLTPDDLEAIRREMRARRS